MTKSTSVAVYPGTFDPITNGHLDVLERALALFTNVIVTIAPNERKHPLFTPDERIAFIREALPHHAGRLDYAVFDGLLVDFCRSRGATVIVRGLRALADFEYEFQFAHMNRRLAPGGRHRVLHDRRAQSLRQLVARQGGRQPRRRRQRPRAAIGRHRARGQVSEEAMSQAVKIASRLDPIKPSITLAVTAKAARLKADGIDVVSFGAGEPDFDTPDHIKDAARESLGKGVGKYTEVAGIAALRKAVATELTRVHNAKIDPADVLVSCGAKHSLFNLIMALLDPGDEVLVPAPYWVSYPDMIMLAGGKPVIVPARADDDFAVTAAQVAAACTAKTRAIVLNNPSNPTGAVYTRAQIEALAEVVVAKNLLVISDDIYRQLVYAGAEYVSIAAVSAALADRTILIDGASKTYAMTGWRIGYAGVTAALSPIIKAMSKIQGQSTSNPTHIAQIAALAALTGPQACVEVMRRAFDERRIEMVRLLRAIPGISCREPKGAFYAFPDLSSFVGKKLSGREAPGDRRGALRLAARCRQGRRRAGLGVRCTGPRPAVVCVQHGEHQRRRRPPGQVARDAELITGVIYDRSRVAKRVTPA